MSCSALAAWSAAYHANAPPATASTATAETAPMMILRLRCFLRFALRSLNARMSASASASTRSVGPGRPSIGSDAVPVESVRDAKGARLSAQRLGAVRSAADGPVVDRTAATAARAKAAGASRWTQPGADRKWNDARGEAAIRARCFGRAPDAPRRTLAQLAHARARPPYTGCETLSECEERREQRAIPPTGRSRWCGAVPRGKAASYRAGGTARAGAPRSARYAAYALHANPDPGGRGRQHPVPPRGVQGRRLSARHSRSAALRHHTPETGPLKPRRPRAPCRIVRAGRATEPLRPCARDRATERRGALAPLRSRTQCATLARENGGSRAEGRRDGRFLGAGVSGGAAGAARQSRHRMDRWRA